MNTLAELMDWLEARVVRDDDCLIWTHSMRGSVPQACLPLEGGGRGTVNVRRVLWTARVGRPPRKDYVIVCSCESEGCVNPEHLKEITRSQLLAGRRKSLAHKLALARSARAGKRAKLTPEQVREIRHSDEPQREIAARMGVTPGHVSGIRLNKWCRDANGNPFAGLGA